MGFFQKKADPISARARALNAEISALEARIKKLGLQARAGQGPRLRSTAYPSGTVTPGKAPAPAAAGGGEPIFEEVHQKQLTQTPEPAATPQHFNELGVRKFDLWAVWQRLRKQFAGRPPANPKLIHYLAAGGIQGLRSLRYEKRVARNRFFLLTAIVAVLCLGIFYWLTRHN
jgi:hypothetical protein